jgi:hypothetical protein
MHELHGVADVEEETPEMLRTRVDEMSKVADSFGENERTEAYRKALETNKDYVEKMKVLCLRADYYDCEKVAARLVSFFSFKQGLFGALKLTRDVILEDFEGDDRKGLENGICQLLQERDQAGRAIVLCSGRIFVESKMDTTVS